MFPQVHNQGMTQSSCVRAGPSCIKGRLLQRSRSANSWGWKWGRKGWKHDCQTLSPQSPHLLMMSRTGLVWAGVESTTQVCSREVPPLLWHSLARIRGKNYKAGQGRADLSSHGSFCTAHSAPKSRIKPWHQTPRGLKEEEITLMA